MLYRSSLFCIRSHLNSLVPVLNKVAKEHLIDNLRSRADGETVVDMLTEFGRATLQMISIVSKCNETMCLAVTWWCVGCLWD